MVQDSEPDTEGSLQDRTGRVGKMQHRQCSQQTMQPADRQWKPCRRGVSLVGGAAKRTARPEKGRQGRRPAIAAGRLQQRQRDFFFFFFVVFVFRPFL